MSEKAIAQELLQSWCDRLLNLQISEIWDERLFGGILCPACHRIHGRSADVLPALLYLHRATEDMRYRTAANRLFYWSEANMRRSDGSMHNDSNHPWNGITVFSAIAMGEALLFMKDPQKDPTFFEDIKEAFLSKVEFVRSDRFLNPLPHVNYIAASAAALELAYRIFHDESMHKEAKRRFETVMAQFRTEENILFGEGHPPAKRSERGQVAVDMGYNLEESYPNLALYASLTQNEEEQRQVADLFSSALSFLLPDGAIDNSWGCRSDQWTYYGSRTSDGMIGGLVLLSHLNPAFSEAARRNLSMMQKCSVDGLLSGGLMYGESEEPICIHHALTHSRALTTYLTAEWDSTEGTLPCDTLGTGATRYPQSGVVRVHRGDWIASIADTDLQPSSPGKTAGCGGALTLLYHRNAGVVASGSMTKFQLSEPNNMQIPRNQEHHDCTTPRIVRGEFSNVFDSQARVITEELPRGTAVSVCGTLTDLAGNRDLPYTLRYIFENDRTCIEISAPEDSEFLFYAVSDEPKPLLSESGEFQFSRGGVRLSIRTDGVITHSEPRIFTPCGGFLSFPVRIQGMKKMELLLL